MLHKTRLAQAGTYNSILHESLLGVMLHALHHVGIYGGRVKVDDAGQQVWGRQYCDHCRGDGPVYAGGGYTSVSELIHRGDHERLQALLCEV